MMFGEYAAEVEEDNPLQEETVGPFKVLFRIAEDDFNKEKKTLFATMVWSGARILSTFLVTDHSDRIRGSSVVELGAGVGLPSLICHKLGAKRVCSTDYPAPTVLATLLENVLRNAENDAVSDCRSSSEIAPRDDLHVLGYLWGEDPSEVLSFNGGQQYDVAIASECLWRHETHILLAKSLGLIVRPGGLAFISFSHHIPGLEENDLKFFEIAREFGFDVESTHTFDVPRMWSDKIAPLFLYVLRKRVS
jgi:EEF1A N-terminal glycine/lysine methyltransferase